jgi:hypothetical protein
MGRTLFMLLARLSGDPMTKRLAAVEVIALYSSETGSQDGNPGLVIKPSIFKSEGGYMSDKQNDLLGSIISKAWSDEQFKRRLLSDTNATLKAEGVQIPEGFEVRAVENTDRVYHLVLPAPPSPQAANQGQGTSPCWCSLLLDWVGVVH